MLEQEFGYRREVKRVPCALSGSYVSADGLCHHIDYKDISNKGVGIAIATPLPVDSFVTIEIDTKRMLPLLVEGRVCWCNKTSDKWRAGIIFDRPLPFELKMIM